MKEEKTTLKTWLRVTSRLALGLFKKPKNPNKPQLSNISQNLRNFVSWSSSLYRKTYTNRSGLDSTVILLLYLWNTKTDICIQIELTDEHKEHAKNN